MKKHQAAVFIFCTVLLFSSSAASCIKVYGKTAQDALQAGFKLAERNDNNAKKDGMPVPYIRVKILPEKEDGFFIAEVHSSNFCVFEFKNDGVDADFFPEIRDCKPKKKSVRAAAAASGRKGGGA